MFEGLANFLQGKGWISNAQLDDEKRRREQQAQQQAQAQPQPASVQTRQVNTPRFATPSIGAPELPQNNFILQKPVTSGFSNQQLIDARNNPNAPYSPELKAAAAANNPLAVAKANMDKINEDNKARNVSSAKSNLLLNQLWAPVQSSVRDIANLPAFVGGLLGNKEFEKDWSTGVSNTIGNIKIGDKTYNQYIEDTERAKDLSIKQIYQSGGDLNEAEKWGLALSETVGSMVSPLETAKAITSVNKLAQEARLLASTRSNLIRQADDIEQVVTSTPASQLGKIDDGVSSPTLAEARISSAKNAANELRQQAEQIVVDMPQAPFRQVDTPNITSQDMPLTLQKATPEQLLARADAGDTQAVAEINRRFDEAQTKLDTETTAPTPEAPVAEIVEPSQPVDNPIESPMTKQSREIAETAQPVMPANLDKVTTTKVQQLLKETAAAPISDGNTRLYQMVEGDLTSPNYFDNVPQLARYANARSGNVKLRFVDVPSSQAQRVPGKKGEAGVYEIVEPDVRPTDIATQDQRISQLYQEAEQHLARADEILGREGTDVGKLGEKLYVADVNNTTAQLTPAEQEAFDYLNSNINDAERVLMSQGIIDKDLGVRRNYLPTGDKEGIEKIFTPEDINASTFNYSKGRSGGFIKADGTVSDKLPEGIRAAYTDYYVRGKGSKYLSDAQVDEIKSSRISQTDMNDIMFGPSKEPLSGLDGKPVKIDDAQISKNADELVALQRGYSDAAKIGDESIVRKAQKAVNQKIIDNSVSKLTQMKEQIDSLIKETKASNLSREQKTARIVELENRLEYARKQAAYQQSYVKTNLLFQVPGRVADQVGKITQSIGDAITAPLTRGVTKEFRPTTQAGKQAARTVASDDILNQRKNNYILNKALNDATSSNILQKAAGRYTAAGTRLTEYGSRQSAPIKDTARYFAAQAEAQGVDDITSYIRNAIGTKEWDRVFNQFSTNRNRFSGVGDITGSAVRGGPGMTKGAVNTWFDGIKSGLNKAIDNTFATTLPRSVRRNIADAISIPLVGFPRVVWNVGSKGMDYATLGLSSLYKASKVSVVDDATALQKALHIRDAIEGAAAGTGLVGLGVLLGQSDMITGPEPVKQANGEWVPPYSLKLGNDYVELGRFIGPYAVPIMLSAAISRGDNATNIASIPALVTSQVLNNFGADSIGDTMSQMGDALNGDLSGLANRIPNMLAAFAPFSGEINSIANATDPYQRETKNDDMFVQFMQQLASKVPGLREQLDVKEDQFGNKIPSSPLKAAIPLSAVGSGWGDTELGSEANRLELKPSGNSNTQKNAEDMANRIIKSEWYQGLDDEGKKDALQSTLYSGKLEDINDSLSDTAKGALAIGTLMGSDERDKWLEDKTNAVNYHVGRYENAIANDTLTAKDDNLENSSSLHYKAIASQVNATLPYWTSTLEEQYKNTSKKELLAMAPDNPVRQALLALDKARASAGVSLKDGDHSAEKYGASSGGGTGNNFSFATASAVKAEKSGFSDPTVKSGWNAPLVKPLGIGEASEKVKRKISVKKGVSL